MGGNFSSCLNKLYFFLWNIQGNKKQGMQNTYREVLEELIRRKILKQINQKKSSEKTLVDHLVHFIFLPLNLTDRQSKCKGCYLCLMFCGSIFFLLSLPVIQMHKLPCKLIFICDTYHFMNVSDFSIKCTYLKLICIVNICCKNETKITVIFSVSQTAVAEINCIKFSQTENISMTLESLSLIGKIFAMREIPKNRIQQSLGKSFGKNK